MVEQRKRSTVEYKVTPGLDSRAFRRQRAAGPISLASVPRLHALPVRVRLVRLLMDSVIRLLRDLIAIDSVNPALVPGGAGEGAVAERVAAALRAAGIDVDVTEVAPGRPNVVGVIEGRAPGRTLMLCGHMDTVGVEGMAAPFDPIARDGRLYGRGSQDMKSGLAALVDAATAMARRGGLAAGRLIAAAVVDEEHASAGAEALVRVHTADGAVVTEPTDLRMATAHKGFEWVEVETRGRAAHGSRPEHGRDAVLHMGRVLGRLEAVEIGLRAGPSHPRLGRASLHASTIHGGQAFSVYPDRCVLGVERRTVTGEASDIGLTEVRAALSALGRDDGSVRRRGAAGADPSTPRDCGRPSALPRAHRGPPPARSRGRPDRHVVLDRRRDSRPRRHPGGAVRPDRRGPSRSAGVCRDRLGAAVP